MRPTAARAWSTWTACRADAFGEPDERRVRSISATSASSPTSRDHVGGTRRLPEQRPHLPQRVLALGRRRFDLGRYAAGQSRRCASTGRHRARLLRHPLAHERVHPRLRPPLLRASPTAKGRYRIDGVPPGTLHRGRVERRLSRRRARSPSRPGGGRRAELRSARRRRRSSVRHRRPNPLLALPTASSWRARCWRCCRSASRSSWSTSWSRARPRPSSSGPAWKRGSWSTQSSAVLRQHLLAEARLVADLPKLKAAVETNASADGAAAGRRLPEAGRSRPVRGHRPRGQRRSPSSASPG